MRYKALTKRFFLISIFIVTALTCGLFAYDPLHLFHKSWVTKTDRFHNDMRLQAAGVINNYGFDSIIVGTSMLKGTSSIRASEKLGGQFVNLSPNGASISERKYIIRHALKKKELKRVIISFDTGMDQNLILSNKKFPVNRFDFLYDEVLVDDLRAYWNYKFIGCFAMYSTSTYCLGNKREVQRPIDWFTKLAKRNQSISGIKSWVNNKKGRGASIHRRIQKHLKSPIGTEDEYQQKLNLTKDIIESSLFSLVKSNENVSFQVIFPPYSRFLYSLWKNKNPYKYQLYLETIKYVVTEGGNFKNLTVYSFDDTPYLDDLNNYRDMRHYNVDMNEVMLDSIKEGKNIINVNNLHSFIELIDEINGSYKLDNELNYLLNSYL